MTPQYDLNTGGSSNGSPQSYTLTADQYKQLASSGVRSNNVFNETGGQNGAFSTDTLKPYSGDNGKGAALYNQLNANIAPSADFKNPDLAANPAEQQRLVNGAIGGSNNFLTPGSAAQKQQQQNISSGNTAHGYSTDTGQTTYNPTTGRTYPALPDWALKLSPTDLKNPAVQVSLMNANITPAMLNEAQQAQLEAGPVGSVDTNNVPSGGSGGGAGGTGSGAAATGAFISSGVAAVDQARALLDQANKQQLADIQTKINAQQKIQDQALASGKAIADSNHDAIMADYNSQKQIILDQHFHIGLCAVPDLFVHADAFVFGNEAVVEE